MRRVIHPFLKNFSKHSSSIYLQLAALDDVDYGIAAAAKVSKFLPSKLPKETQVLMDMIFSTEMFVHSMKEYDIGSEFVYGVNYNKPKCLIPLASQYLLLFFL